MPHYVIVYLGGRPPANPEEGKRHMAEYRRWLESLGPAAISPANPLLETRTIGPDGTVATGSGTRMSGYTVVAADSMEAAVSMARACPFLATGGSLEVSRLGQITGPA